MSTTHQAFRIEGIDAPGPMELTRNDKAAVITERLAFLEDKLKWLRDAPDDTQDVAIMSLGRMLEAADQYIEFVQTVE
jgi:hypothetical protein